MELGIVSLIDIYKAARSDADRVNTAYLQAAGLDSPNNDKHRIECRFVSLVADDWTPATLRFHASHGYYGSPSGYSDMSPTTAQYVAKAITQMGTAIMARAAALAAEDAETARLAAESEARDVLASTAAAAS